MEDEQAAKTAFWGWMKILANPAVLFYALPWLMVLLTIGTLAQRDLGIYEAQRIFFSSWILCLVPLPLPGSYITLGVITLCLFAKFIFYSPWRAHQAGIILTHLGVLILLIGGILTAFSQEEGFISLGQGQSGQAISEYHDRVMRIEKDGEIFVEIPFEKLRANTKLGNVSLPFEVQINDLCSNCRPSSIAQNKSRHGLAQKVQLNAAPSEKEEEANLSGVTMTLSGLDGVQNGTYIMMEEIPHKPTISTKAGTYVFSMGRAQRPLPFEITLNNFKRDVHPGTDMASGFSSDVTIKDGSIEWPYIISMNEPLRYKGYTFYQASFSMRPDGEYSILSVVQNNGRIFPYLASIVIFAGLLLHLVIRLNARRKAQG